ncbi:hypothetical protein HGRIS_006314 [Hohenbuehelia grisea]|uniref:NCA2-domain-containing protein n=1 Tax=Hohenbuehelia grisea TaxID=104357 RepID=A0ABR3K1T9_9AGAR
MSNASKPTLLGICFRVYLLRPLIHYNVCAHHARRVALPIRLKDLLKSLSQGVTHPAQLAASVFPHLRRHDRLLALPSSFAVFLPSPQSLPSLPTSAAAIQSSAVGLADRIRNAVAFALAALTLPFELAQQECRAKRRRLQRVRDQRASVLGALAQQREVLQAALATDDLRGSLAACINSLQRTAHLRDESTSFDTNSPVDALRVTFAQLLPDHQHAHSSLLSSYLARPGRLTRIWPKIVFLPPLVLFAVRALYNRKSSLAELYEEAKETVRGFVRGWILDPLADIVRTVRAGSDEDAAGIIIRKEGVKADLDSLERMAVSLAQDKLAYTPAQVDALRTQIAAGDLTPVLEIYEADIRTPLRSALTGTLLRSVFIQVQKAKVDIDQALTGIDKLIKSQELTFAFVGVAPALVVAYVLGGYLRTALSGTAARLGLPGAQRHQDRYGGRTERARVAAVMRRVERLLVRQGAKSEVSTAESGVAGVGEVTPLTHGLLLVSLAHLRAYAVQWLPAHKGFLREDGPGVGLGLIGTSPDVEPSSSTGVPASLVQEDREPEEAEEVGDEGEEGANGGGDEYTGGDTGMREGFLEDVGDLEDPRLAREDRLRVVDRMWRCWGARLGWGVGGA